MGYIKHHALIVTSWDLDALAIAHGTARGLSTVVHGSERYVTPITDYTVNGGGSFAILPDGSKEDWPESARGDELRDRMVEYLESKRYDDGSSALHYVEVAFAGDKPADTKVERSFRMPLPEVHLLSYGRNDNDFRQDVGLRPADDGIVYGRMRDGAFEDQKLGWNELLALLARIDREHPELLAQEVV